MRMRKKPNLDVRLGRCERYLIRQPEEHRGHWRELMPGCRELRLELGCGKGRFTAETAAQEPEVLFIALERVPDAMVIAVERVRDLGVKNVFFIDGDAAKLEEYFAPGEVERIYINFCDPWPSNRHAKRRLTHPDFLLRYRTVLGPGRSIHFKTDNAPLFEWSLLQFPKAGYTLSQVTRNLHANGVQGVMTDYEEKFYALGTPINRCEGTVAELPQAAFPELFSLRLSRWRAREVREADLVPVLELLGRSGDYFSLPGAGDLPTEESLRTDLVKLPPRCTMEQKHYLALWREGQAEAAVDLVGGYPQADTLFVGLFVLPPELRGAGNGKEIVRALLRAAAEAGFTRVRLACLKTNPGGHAFWRAMGFQDLREGRVMPDGGEVWIMERTAVG